MALPAAPDPDEQLAFVKAVRPPPPELDALGNDAISSPSRRAGHGSSAERPTEPTDGIEQLSAPRQRCALMRGGGGEAARPRSCRPIGVGFRIRHDLDPSLDAHLLAVTVPIEHGGGTRVL